MSTYTLKSVIRRGTMFGLAAALGLATLAPAASTFADALNPLTERSLTLSSGSPGWNYKDASGNATYAPPNSGANGKKTGNTFSFRVSSTEALSAMTFQYCTTPAGNCMGPGNITKAGTAGSYTRADNATAEANQESDLEIVTDTVTPANVQELTSTGLAKLDLTLGQPAAYTPPNGYDPDTVHPSMPALDGSEGNFVVLHKSTAGADWEVSSGWSMTTEERQVYKDSGGVMQVGTVADGTSTGKHNFIKIANSGSQNLTAGDYVKVIFFATNNTYITNPGADEFFVKINTYNNATTEDETTLVDGGVTVANVMNRSIEIQTKVLETMQFSVGTVDPNTLSIPQLTAATGLTEHTPCDPIAQSMTRDGNNKPVNPNVLQLGDANGEFSLRTDKTYSTHSYWRLSSNSSGGATVYYSGVTLSNTVGDQIKPIGKAAAAPTVGGEQFGLALDNGINGTQYEVSYAKERATDNELQNGADNAVTGVDQSTLDDVGSNLSWHTPRLYPLAPIYDDTDGANIIDYSKGTGVVNVISGNPFGYADNSSITTKFAFDPDSNTIPTPIADGTQVLDCVTGKMRYIANIAATTPAGIYTTKVNYIAAPKY